MVQLVIVGVDEAVRHSGRGAHSRIGLPSPVGLLQWLLHGIRVRRVRLTLLVNEPGLDFARLFLLALALFDPLFVNCVAREAVRVDVVHRVVERL